MHVAIVGAGIVGVAAAHALLDGGHAVTLIDPDDQPGRPCDGNAGWIAHTDVMPLASAKVWRHVPRWLMDPLGPLTIRPSYIPAISPWMLRFVAASRPDRIERSVSAIRALNGAALPAWRRRLGALGLAHHLRENGTLSVWSSEAAFRSAAATIERQQAFGIPVELLDRKGIEALEPALGKRAVAGALFRTDCHVGDPKVLVADLADLARQRGASWIRGRASALDFLGDGVDVQLAGGARLRAEKVIVAAGAWSKPLAARIGDRIPLDTERGYNVTLPRGTLGLSRPVAFQGEGFVTTPLDCGDRVGGAVEFAGLEAPPNYERANAIMTRLRSFLPNIPVDASRGRQWMGFRPSIPDSLPVIGAARRSDRILYSFGHGHYGLTQAAVTAEILVSLIDRTRPPLDIKPYAASRF